MKHFDDFSENDLLDYIKDRNLSYPAVILLDIVCPFNNVLAYALTVFSPMLNIFFKSAKVDLAITFFKSRNQINQLKKRLLEET